MKNANADVIQYLADVRAGKKQLQYTDTYLFELVDDNHTVLAYSAGQRTFIGTPPEDGSLPITYVAGKVLVSGLRYRLAVGTDVDEQECKIAVKDNGLQVLGFPFLVAARLGLFDKATVTRVRYFFPDGYGQPTIGGVTFFRGFLSTTTDIGTIDCTAKVKSGMILLNTPMPHELYQPQCLNTLFDARCKLLSSDFAQHGTVELPSTRQIIAWSSSQADTYSQGTIRFETGPNLGSVRTIRQSTDAALILTYPLDFDPGEDDFVVFPGCDKSKATCVAKFDNIANFRGYPYVPPPETAT